MKSSFRPVFLLTNFSLLAQAVPCRFNDHVVNPEVTELVVSSLPDIVIDSINIAKMAVLYPNLKKLTIKNTGLVSVPKFLEKLTLLQEFSFISNPFAIDFSAIESLSALPSFTSLKLSSNEKMVLIPDEIISLRKLKTLDLSNNSLAEVNPRVYELIELEKLNLSGNLINFLPKSLVELKTPNLFIDLRNNPIDEYDFFDNWGYETLKGIPMIQLNEDYLPLSMEFLRETLGRESTSWNLEKLQNFTCKAKFTRAGCAVKELFTKLEKLCKRKNIEMPQNLDSFVHFDKAWNELLNFTKSYTVFYARPEVVHSEIYLIATIYELLDVVEELPEPSKIVNSTISAFDNFFGNYLIPLMKEVDFQALQKTSESVFRILTNKCPVDSIMNPIINRAIYEVKKTSMDSVLKQLGKKDRQDIEAFWSFKLRNLVKSDDENKCELASPDFFHFNRKEIDFNGNIGNFANLFFSQFTVEKVVEKISQIINMDKGLATVLMNWMKISSLNDISYLKIVYNREANSSHYNLSRVNEHFVKYWLAKLHFIKDENQLNLK